ncbi:MAG: PhzF family phenazine biosynthesis protein [Cyclobacteriaceae bacterium]|nr:PhzF family phenazine biosynthesis protein [Cyclobacteriaceae bacterium]
MPETISRGFNIKPQLSLKSRDYILVFDGEEDIREIKVDPTTLNQINIDPGAIVITAPGNQVDFVSRVFTPQASIFEDPATGSTHCSLIPWWSKKLGKSKLTALQLSDRQGYFQCEDLGHRVLISGQCHAYLAAKIYI